MDQELVDYVFRFYQKHLGLKEQLAQRHAWAVEKSRIAESTNVKEQILQKWGTYEKDVLALLENGYDAFKRNCAEKIMDNHADKVFINKCPVCSRLARTPTAKQCRYCGHDWH